MSNTVAHLKTLQRLQGIRVRLGRGHSIGGEVVAVPAKSKATIVGADGSFTVVTVDDWLVFVSEWCIGMEGEPEKGDVISFWTGGNDGDQRYIVGHPDGVTPVFTNFNQLDRPAKAWRIHTIPYC